MLNQAMLQIDQNYVIDFLVELLNIPSPTGFTNQVQSFINAQLVQLGLGAEQTNKGAEVATLTGKSEASPRAVTAHVDTLGAMVRAINPNGRLQLTKVGGFGWPSTGGRKWLTRSRDPAPTLWAAWTRLLRYSRQLG